MSVNFDDKTTHENESAEPPTINSIQRDTPPSPKGTVAPFAPPQQQNHLHNHEREPRPSLTSAPLYWSVIHHKDLHSQDASSKDSSLRNNYLDVSNNQAYYKKPGAHGENHAKASKATKTDTASIVENEDNVDIPDDNDSTPSGQLETIPSCREEFPEEHQQQQLAATLSNSTNNDITRIIQEREGLLEKESSSRRASFGYGSTNSPLAISSPPTSLLTSLHFGGNDLEQGLDTQQKQSSYPVKSYHDSATRRNSGWDKVREMVHTDELFIHTIPDMEDDENAGQNEAMDSSSRRRSSFFQSLRGGNNNNSSAKSKSQKSSSRRWNILSYSHQCSTTKNNKKWSDLDDVTYEFTLRECLFLTIFLLTIGVSAYSFLFERWSIIDSLYFTTVCLTTVGYGDYSPSTPSGKLFASVFALGGVVVLGLALGIVGSQLVEAEIKYAEKMKARTAKALESAFTATIRRRKRHHEKKEREDERRRLSDCDADPSTRSLLRSSSNGSTISLSSLESIDSVGSLESGMMSIRSIRPKDDRLKDVLIEKQNESILKRMRNCVMEWYIAIRLHSPGFIPMVVGAMIMARLEQWAWYDGIYYCVVTATTIGFGDLSPTQPHTKLFAIVFVPMCVAVMGYILGNFASFMVEQRREGYEKKLWSCDLKVEDIEALDTDHDGAVSELEYIRFMLIAMKKVDAQLLDDLHAQFCHLDTTGDGRITKRDLQVMAARKLRKVSHKLELSEYKRKLKQIKGNKRSFLLNAISRKNIFEPLS